MLSPVAGIASQFSGLLRTLIPFMGAAPAGLHDLPKPPPANIITLEAEASTQHFGEDIDIQSITVKKFFKIFTFIAWNTHHIFST